MILDDDILFKVTKKKRPSAQAKVLKALGVPYRLRPDGTLFVLESALEAVSAKPKQPRAEQPNWEFLKKHAA